MKVWGKVSQEFIRKTMHTYRSNYKCSFAIVLKKKNQGRKEDHTLETGAEFSEEKSKTH